ncbi:hypothetical protein ACI2OW_25670 [Pseudomonas shirazica]|jgi:hypothetical protein|uniref:hypothetical protein n=1 Tax=Pseudomonas TaxID=286 RepID=UPI00244715A6|nr:MULTISPECIES: hypothetical protein [Pseudomonas]MDY4312166.1 hypothetical protein [Pseudomonas putida]MDH0135700.1 hypothetical protein [Pseudomonas asiatica]MDY4322063.1 hypothetical protein [Pseudomonas putida]MDY4355028.1 hypothetical protein [Pseudomonas putida]WIV25232.1 hypothetical protein QN085_06390 [Pseudomonas sp. M2(2023)]
MSTKYQVEHFKTRLQPRRPSAAKLQVAPVDENFGDQGYCYLVDQDSARHSLCADIVQSPIKAGVFYSVAQFYRTADNQNDTFIVRLDADGKVEKRLVKIQDHLSEGTFWPEQLIADANGKILCLGTATVHDSTASRIWRFNDDGSLDTGFAGKGYIEADDLNLSGLIQIWASADGYFVTGQSGTYKLLALASNGSINEDFGQRGTVDLASIFSQPVIGSLGLCMAVLGRNCIVTAILNDADDNFYSQVVKIAHDGKLDTQFADRGRYTAEHGTLYHNLSVDAPSQVITVYGSHTFDDFKTEFPEVQRLDADGKPHEKFNEGNPLRFTDPGAWDHMHEFEGRLMGWGGFYTHNRAVCYTLEGQLDTSFVPPDGYGMLGVPPGAGGFEPDYDASVAFVANPGRMLVCGQNFYNDDKSVDAVIAAIAYS